MSKKDIRQAAKARAAQASGDKEAKRIAKLEAKLKEVTDERDAAETVANELERQLLDERLSKFKFPKQRKGRKPTRKSYYRAVLTDTHGASIDGPAWSAFLDDMKLLAPKEIVHMGDFVDCGGWLAEHQSMSYVGETQASYMEDIEAAQMMLDTLQEAVPAADFHLIQGNHDARPEKWAIQQTRRNRVDSAYLAKHVIPENILQLEKRGINFYRRDTNYNGIRRNSGSIMLGKCAFTHPQRASKHHASAMASSWGCNVVFGHTHRRDSFFESDAQGRQWGAWNPGCLCKTQKYYHHSENWNHSHGWHLQIVQPCGSFLGINVPIIDGRSYMSDLLRGV